MADLPADLKAQLTRAHEALAATADGELPLRERQAIRERFGPFEPTDGAHAPPGLRRRVKLGELCARRVLDLWHADRPDDDQPERLLELAHQVLERTLDRQEARREAHRFFDRMQQMDIGDTAATAAEAARKVVMTATSGDSADVANAESEEEIEPDDWDPTFVAALAAAGYPDEDPDRRRAYWRWYLDEAVPEAWRAG